jgi:hypothetical protein
MNYITGHAVHVVVWSQLLGRIQVESGSVLSFGVHHVMILHLDKVFFVSDCQKDKLKFKIST